MPTLELREVFKKYGTVEAVRGISLECRDREFLVILGPSGAGKTSTLKMIAGLEPLSGGEIRIDGRCADALPPKDRDVAMVFETYALYPHLTVCQNLAFPLRSPAFRLPEEQIEARVRETARILQMESLLHRRPAELSGGQKQRVSLGRALIRRPGLLLMDEPLSHLDAHLRHRMRRELKRMQAARQSTVVYVTHDYLEALALADRLVILDRGRVRQTGTPSEVYHSPADTSVALLLGHPRINLLSARIRNCDTDSDRLVLESEAGILPLPEEFRPLLQGRTEVVLGIRPHHIRLEEEASGHGWQGRVYAHENLGYRNLLEIEAGSCRLDVRCRESNFAVGSDTRLTFAESRLLLFDKNTGKNLKA